MKKNKQPSVVRRFLNSYFLILPFLTACRTPVDVSGDYSVPGTNVSAAVAVGTNGVTLDGGYQTGTTNINGSITVGKIKN